MKGDSDGCAAATRAGATIDAIGSTLLALAGRQQAGAIIHQRTRSVRAPEHARQAADVRPKPSLALPPPVHLHRLRQQNESAKYQMLTTDESAK